MSRSKKKKQLAYQKMCDEVYDLDIAFAEWMIPRLKIFMKNRDSYPSYLTDAEWQSLLEEMLEGMYCIQQRQQKSNNKENREKAERALDIFRTHFNHLWI